MRTRRRRPAPTTRTAFAGFSFPPDVIVLAVRWYLRFGLSNREARNCSPNAASRSTTSPSTGGSSDSRRCLLLPPDPAVISVGDRWSVDETCVKVGGRWRYVYRAIDQFGQVIDV
jgi:transposase-like protein